jgi:hypothetical protein
MPFANDLPSWIQAAQYHRPVNLRSATPNRRACPFRQQAGFSGLRGCGGLQLCCFRQIRSEVPHIPGEQQLRLYQLLLGAPASPGTSSGI